jgi:hypothetical protein
MMADRSPLSVPPRSLILALAVAGLLTLPALAAGQPGARTEYDRVLLREAAARDGADPTLVSLRAIAAAYEELVRRYPRSDLSDDALWRAANVLELAHARFGYAADRIRSAGLVAWLRREYPHSSLARQELPIVVRELASGTDSTPILVTASAGPAAPPHASTAPLQAGGGAALRAITHMALPEGDRITIELTREVSYAAARLDTPDRI